MTRLCQIQRGFAAIAAIFLVVVLAALGGFMLSFSNTQQLTSAQDVQGSRAYWAARAGLEWSVSSLISSSACPSPTETRLVVDGFMVCVVCASQTYTEASATPNITMFKLESIARSSVLSACTDTPPVGTVGYIERSVSASVER